MTSTSPKPVRALDLEALVIWAIRTQKADRTDVALFDVEAAVGGLEPRGWSVDGVATMMHRGDLGCRIDGCVAVRGVAPRMHPDAELVALVIGAMVDRRARGIILHQARIGERPDWLPWEQRLAPLPAESGAGRGNRCKIVGEWRETAHRSEVARQMLARGDRLVDAHGRSRIVAEEQGFRFRVLDDGRRQVFERWCPVVPEPSIDEIRIVNDNYAVWHAGMMYLLGELVGAPLREHRVKGLAAPAQPWNSPEP